MTATDEAMVPALRFFIDDETGMISNTLKRVTKNFVPRGIYICLPLWVAKIGNEPNFAVRLCSEIKNVIFFFIFHCWCYGHEWSAFDVKHVRDFLTFS